MTEPGDRSLPFQIDGLRDVPSGRGHEPLRNARSSRSAKLWPVNGLGTSGAQASKQGKDTERAN